MASTLLSLLLLSTLSLLLQPPFAAANLQATTALFRSQPASEELHPLSAATTADIPPTTFFEVTKPIPLPNTKPCSYLVLQHDFASTYGKTPVLADYKPPSDCPSQNFSRIVLEWTATSKGRQFDRIFGVWLGGVEILRSCTAEPRATGIVWTVKKDITRYHSLLMSNQTLAVYIGNIVDSTYTGVYHVNVSMHFYPAEKGSHHDHNKVSNGELESGSGADLILPISRSLPLKDGLWFEIENSTDVESMEFKIPQNAYRAVLEVYVSPHENDEFWFGNFPNEYIYGNNLTGFPGNGPFREVIVSLDNFVVGAVWPFTVVYTGGVNPLLWRPITGIGSFDLPSYDIEITPFLGKILDGKNHQLAFSVANALNVWYIDANLHLWLDKNIEQTQGKLLEYSKSPLSFSVLSNFTGFNGTFTTNVSRSIVSNGWVKSSRGITVTKSIQDFEYSNTMELGNEGNLQIIDQVINHNGTVVTKTPSSALFSTNSLKKFTTRCHTDSIDKGNNTFDSVSNVTLGVSEKRQKFSASGVSTTLLKNLQNGQGSMLVKGHLVQSGVGSTQQEYHYTSDESCYFRNVRSYNYTILHDKESRNCKHRSHRWWPFLPRTNLLGSKFKGGRKGLI